MEDIIIIAFTVVLAILGALGAWLILFAAGIFGYFKLERFFRRMDRAQRVMEKKLKRLLNG